MLKPLLLVILSLLVTIGGALTTQAQEQVFAPRIPGVSESALELGRDLDGDGDPDEITIRL